MFDNPKLLNMAIGMMCVGCFASDLVRESNGLLREHGERWLKPVTFIYWRKLLQRYHWQPMLFGKDEFWNP